MKCELTDQLTLSTKVKHFGLLGHPLGHSLSPVIHERIAQALGMVLDYTLFDLAEEALAEGLPERLADLDGYNCTIPYKQLLADRLEDLDETALLFHSVNTVYRNKGYNTDAAGFLNTCGFDYKGAKVLILGCGGVSHTFAHCVAREAAAEIVLTSREPEAQSDFLNTLKLSYPHCHFSILRQAELTALDFSFVLNGTPLGMWPQTTALPLAKDYYLRLLQAGQLSGVFDAVYNPVVTRFLLMARSRGVRAVSGLGMLFEQAILAEKIWWPEFANRFAAAETQEKLEKAAASLTEILLGKYPISIVITGFMSSGKSTLLKRLRQSIGNGFVLDDLDELIERHEGRTIKAIFEAEGEAYFRRIERTLLEEQLSQGRSCILSVGGGALVQDGAAAILKRYNTIVVCLDISPDTALTRSLQQHGQRPLLTGSPEDCQRLYEARKSKYLALADVIIDAEQTAEEVEALVLTCLGLKAANH